MKNIFSIILLIIYINITTCLFDKVKYMTSYEDSTKLYNTIIQSKKISLVLIYSDGCPHCKNFEKDYIKLSEKYNTIVNFYLLPSKFNNKKFKIRGVPTVFFFNGKKFIEHQGHNKYDIISYIIEYNPFHPLWKNKQIKGLAKEFVNIYQGKNILEASLNVMNNKFKEPSPFRAMLSFKNNFSLEKKYLEFYFKVMMLKQNIQDIIKGINDLLGIKSEIIENQLKKLKFKNPYSIFFIRKRY